MATIHLFLAGLGQSGKSTHAAIFAQYLADKGTPPKCIDIDPGRSTLAGYQGLDVSRIDVMDGGDDVDPRRFDLLVGALAEAEQPVIVDSGAEGFLPLSSYLHQDCTLQLLQEVGHEPILHGMVVGGGSMNDSLSALYSLLKAENFQDAPVIAWINRFFGEVERDGRSFMDMRVHREHEGRYRGIVQLPLMNERTREDVSAMLASRLTFEEVLKSADFELACRHRIKMHRGRVWKAIEQANLAGTTTPLPTPARKKTKKTAQA